MNTAAVAVYAIAQRLAEALLENDQPAPHFPFSGSCLPRNQGRTERQQQLMVTANRFQLAIAVCLCGGIAAVADVLIPAWVGPGFEGSVLAVQILAFVVVLRAWIAMPSTVLKGNNQHRYLARIASVGAVANLLLSIPLVKSWGIPGVAIGTAVPVFISCAVFIFPRACRQVGLNLVAAYRVIVWPAVWPALVVITLLAATRQLLPVRMTFVLAHLATGGLVYAVLFFRFGLSRPERLWMTSAVAQLWGDDGRIWWPRSGDVMTGVIFGSGTRGAAEWWPRRRTEMPRRSRRRNAALTQYRPAPPRAGIDNVIVVVGCAADLVRRSCTEVTFVRQQPLRGTNSLYSLWLARDLLRDGFVVLNCDVLFHPQLLGDLLTAARRGRAADGGYRAASDVLPTKR